MYISNINIGYLGKEESIHCENTITLFKNVNKDIKVLPIYDLYRTQSNHIMRFWNKIANSTDKFLGVHDKDCNQKIEEFFLENRINCLLAFWGTIPIPYMIKIKKSHPEVKIILNVLCHPIGLTASKIFIQNKLLRRSLEYCDGLVYPSHTMKEYFDKNITYGKKIPFLILPPFLTRKYFSTDPIRNCLTEPNLLFLGRMDWWRGHPTDNLLTQITDIMNLGIHVYHAADSQDGSPLPYHVNRHVFPSLSFEQLKVFSSQFDASIVMYNLNEDCKDDRFRTTVPDRLIASVAMGLPIVIPRSGYDACKEFLENYEAVIEFSSYDELKEIMFDRNYIMNLRIKAKDNMKNYIAENHIVSLVDFINKIHEMKKWLVL